MKKLFGITTALVTPFDDNDRLDLAKTRQLVDYLVERGVHGLYPAGSTGEMDSMTVDERKKLAEAVVEQNNGRVNAFIQVGAFTLADTITLAKHAHDIGADGIGVITPIYFKVSAYEMEEYYVSVAKSVPEDFPVYTYNIPQMAGNDLTPKLCERIVKRAPNVVGIKYSFPDMLLTAEYAKVNGGNFSVIQGADNLLGAVMAMGCEGVVSAAANLFPEILVNAYNVMKTGSMPQIREQEKLAYDSCYPLISGTGGLMACLKAGLKLRGLDVGHVRRPLMDLTPQEFAEFKEKLKKVFAAANGPVLKD